MNDYRVDIGNGPEEEYFVDEDFARLEEAVKELQKNFSNQEDKLRNMANKLEEHMGTPDAHNPGIMRKK